MSVLDLGYSNYVEVIIVKKIRGVNVFDGYSIMEHKKVFNEHVQVVRRQDDFMENVYF